VLLLLLLLPHAWPPALLSLLLFLLQATSPVLLLVLLQEWSPAAAAAAVRTSPGPRLPAAVPQPCRGCSWSCSIHVRQQHNNSHVVMVRTAGERWPTRMQMP
jgi:anaerobic selenocysteine-containing dehydrogenase